MYDHHDLLFSAFVAVNCCYMSIVLWDHSSLQLEYTTEVLILGSVNLALLPKLDVQY